MMCCTVGFPLTGSSGFGVVSVRGRSRVPKPPAKIIAVSIRYFSMLGVENALFFYGLLSIS